MSNIEDIRNEIEHIDVGIIKLIQKRVDMASKVLEAKRKDSISINDPSQNTVVLERAVDIATELNLDISAVKEIFEILIRMNIERQEELSGEGNLP